MTTLELFLAGDVMTGRGIDQILPHACPPHLYERHADSALEYVELAELAHGRITREADCDYVWGDALQLLANREPAIRLINLETSVTTCEAVQPKGINYRMHPQNMRVFEAARIDGCALANNHVLDWGEEGLLETLECIDRAGIKRSGAGRDLAGAQAPAAFELPAGARVLFFSFGAPDSGIPRGWAARPDRPGVHRLDDFSEGTVRAITRMVDRFRTAGDLLIASIHWGGNWGYEVSREHRHFAHRLIDQAGFDLIHGHSSHHPKGIEVYRGKPILYGCGDLLNDYEGIGGFEPFRPELTLMYFPTFDLPTGRMTLLEMTPIRIQRFRLEKASGADREWLRRTINGACSQFGTRVVEDGAGGLVLRGWP